MDGAAQHLEDPPPPGVGAPPPAWLAWTRTLLAAGVARNADGPYTGQLATVDAAGAPTVRTQINVLRLSADGHRRLRFAFDGEGFQGTWVLP